MRTLYLLRHAKSSWSRPLRRDHERPLTRRGRVASRRVAGYLARHRPPDLVLASTAVRTLETAHRVGARWNPPPPIREVPELYLATSSEMLSCIRAVTGPSVLMLVGHNPGTSELAALLSVCRRTFADKFPTAGLAVFSLAIDDWTQASAGVGKLEAFVTPRRIPNLPTDPVADSTTLPPD